MNSNRSLLVVGLLLVSFLLFTQWQQDFNPEIQAQKQAQIQAQQQSGDVPAATSQTQNVAESNSKGKTTPHLNYYKTIAKYCMLLKVV